MTLFSALVADSKKFAIQIFYRHTMTIIFNDNAMIIYQNGNILSISIPSISYRLRNDCRDAAIQLNSKMIENVEVNSHPIKRQFTHSF